MQLYYNEQQDSGFRTGSHTHSFVVDKEKGIVTKKLINDPEKSLNEEAFNTYKEMSAGNSNYVQVYDMIDNYSFTMEYVPNVINHLGKIIRQRRYDYLITQKFIINALAVFHNLLLDSLKITQLYNDKQKRYFINRDAQLSNILVTEDGKFKIIDPDSYQWVSHKNLIGVITPYYMAQINLAMHLQRSLLESK